MGDKRKWLLLLFGPLFLSRTPKDLKNDKNDENRTNRLWWEGDFWNIYSLRFDGIKGLKFSWFNSMLACATTKLLVYSSLLRLYSNELAAGVSGWSTVLFAILQFQ